MTGKRPSRQRSTVVNTGSKIVSTASTSKRYERFAGMGIAQLIYPYKAMEPYFSMTMADALLLDDWYAADVAWEERLDRLAANGELILHLEKEEFYIDFADGHPEWAEKIHKFKDGTCVKNYLEAVDAVILSRFAENKGEALQEATDILKTLL